MLHIILYQTGHTTAADAKDLPALMRRADFYSPEDRATTAADEIGILRTHEMAVKNYDLVLRNCPRMSSFEQAALRAYRDAGSKRIILPERTDDQTALRINRMRQQTDILASEALTHLVTGNPEHAYETTDRLLHTLAEVMTQRDDLVIASVLRESLRHGPRSVERTWLLSMGTNHRELARRISALDIKGLTTEVLTDKPHPLQLTYHAVDALQRRTPLHYTERGLLQMNLENLFWRQEYHAGIDNAAHKFMIARELARMSDSELSTIVRDSQQVFARGGQTMLFHYTARHNLNDFTNASAYAQEHYPKNDVTVENGRFTVRD